MLLQKGLRKNRTAANMPVGVLFGLTLLQSGTKKVDMHAMLVGYAHAHAPPHVATLVDARLTTIIQQDSDGSALRHALASLLLDELHPRGDDGSLARSILYAHKYALESRFERRAAAVEVLTTDAYKKHPTLLEKNRPKVLEGEEKEKQYTLRVKSLERIGLLEHAYARSPSAPAAAAVT